MKYFLLGLDTDNPRVYFMDTNTHASHHRFITDIIPEGQSAGTNIPGEVIYFPELLASDGSLGAYGFVVNYSPVLDLAELAHTLLAASMPLIKDNLVLYIPNALLPVFHDDVAVYQTSRLSPVFDKDVYPETTFLSLNPAEWLGFLQVMTLDERPNPRDVVIYEALPNNLPRVAGIITTVRQTTLSHVNLRAIQDAVPNAFIRDALDDGDIDALIDGYVRYEVTETEYAIRAATKAEVDDHHESSRPAEEQTPQRDLSVTEITPLSEIGFDDWDAFGVKAANVAVLGKLDFPEGTVPDGFAVPFYFYDEFMKHNDFYTRIETMLADTDFQENFDTQEDELEDPRTAIEVAEAPAWILTAMADMNDEFPDGINRRYRSSTNNEDLSASTARDCMTPRVRSPMRTWKTA